MSSVVYNDWKKRAFEAWRSGKTIDLVLVMTNTTAGAENDGKVNVADLTTLDECDDTGYSRATLDNHAITKDDANDRAELDADDETITGLNGDASRDAAGVLFVERVDGTAANDLLGWYLEFASPRPISAGPFAIPWDAEGILHGT